MLGLENIDVNMMTEQYLIPWGLALVKALLIFVIGRIVVGFIVRMVAKLLERSKLDPLLVSFVTTIVKAILLLFVIIAALNELGVNTTSLVAVIGAAGLAIGLALQGSLQNFSSGTLLIMFRPIAKGEFVEIAGTSGVVESIHLFHTELRSTDNKMIVVPNGEIFDSVITNYSRHDKRRVDMVFGIGYDDDIDKARDVFTKVLEADSRILKDPAPQVIVGELAGSSVNFNVRPWVKTEDYWPVKAAITENIKKACDSNGISIPYPQTDVHLHRVAEE